MNGLATLLALTVMGVSFDWRPLEQPQGESTSKEATTAAAVEQADGIEYLVYVEPELIDLVQQGKIETIESNIPENLGPVRRIKVVLGTAKPYPLAQERRMSERVKQTVAKPVMPDDLGTLSKTAKRHTVKQQPSPPSQGSASGQLQRLEQSFTNQLDATSGRLNNSAAEFGRSLQSVQQQGADAFRTAQNSFAEPQPTIGSNLRDGTRKLLDRTGDALRNTGEAVEGTVQNFRNGVRSAIGADSNRGNALPPAPVGSNDYRPYSYNYTQPSSTTQGGLAPGTTQNFATQPNTQDQFSSQGQGNFAGQPTRDQFYRNNASQNRGQEQSVLLQRDSQNTNRSSDGRSYANDRGYSNERLNNDDYNVNLQQPRGDYRLDGNRRQGDLNNSSRSNNSGYADDYAQSSDQQQSNSQQGYFNRNQRDSRDYDSRDYNNDSNNRRDYPSGNRDDGRFVDSDRGPALPLLEDNRPDSRLVPVDDRQGGFANNDSRSNGDRAYDRSRQQDSRQGDGFGDEFYANDWRPQNDLSQNRDDWDVQRQNDPAVPNPNDYIPQPQQPNYNLPPAGYDPNYVDNGTNAPLYNNQPPLRPIGVDPRGNPLDDPRVTPTSSRTDTAADEPWGALVLATAVCFGSLGGNLFLGYSYLDARNKYRSALRRTGRAFGIGSAE